MKKGYHDKSLELYEEFTKLLYSLKWNERSEMISDWNRYLNETERMNRHFTKLELKEDKEFSTVHLKDSVYITDPCHEVGTWCQGLVTNIMPGEYRCIRRMTEDTVFNTTFRVAQIRVIRIGYEAANLKYKKLPITVGVDSGQAGIFNKDYYEKNQPNEDWYEKICEITDENHFGVINDEGVVSRSGYGDGSYRAYAAYANGKIVGIKIYFI